ncbi:efflux RND transporter periplasmic adaptor subunit [Lentimicrobium sp. L6]|uniref:efflux RND transporter periplasmic adaptor subunit n=1 Tax=Lentimicrobium sp. L6 TaxID=2735916 RepID=UPI00155693EF|nr:efflux RND transporter periplasmic adaptor subunit [Lentimicrobium sp. L6]NPD84426.1 efflux RND transporter periplasmic adaptor subunit [Lentimicrobium sp. L6]
MNYRIYLMVATMLIFVACKNNSSQNNTTEHEHVAGVTHDHEQTNVHQHKEGEECNHDQAEKHTHAAEENHKHDHKSEHQHQKGEECNHEHAEEQAHQAIESHHHNHINGHQHGENGEHQKPQNQIIERNPEKVLILKSEAAHDHAAETANSGGHAHDEVKYQITAYSNEFELFAETDPFSNEGSSSILAHFTWLDDFSPLQNARIKAEINTNGQISQDIQTQMLRPGIYRFNIQAKKAGDAILSFHIETKNGVYSMYIPEIKVFADAHAAMHWDAPEANTTNTTSFTKEQSWKVAFGTERVGIQPFGKTIKTTALTKPCVAGEAIISSKSNGIVDLQSNHITEGMQVKKGQKLFVISGSDLANDNSSVRYVEAKNNYEKAVSNFERIMELEKDKIVTSKEVLEAKNEFENTKVIFDNLQANFSLQGQSITSPIDGYINNLRVSNGEYVEAGYPLLAITKNQRLILNADVQQKYAAILPQIYTANIKNIYNNNTYSLEELNGHILSYGKTTNSNNYLIPISIEIDNTDDFVAGGFVELYLKYQGNESYLNVPNSALLEEQGNFFVYVQVHPELFEKREVFIGASDGERTEILKGLSAHERIVSKGAILIKLAQATGGLDAHSGHVH